MAVMMESRELRGKQLVIFKRGNSPYWQARIKLESEPYIYKSLKIKDPAEAKVAAEDILGELIYRKANGFATKTVTFRQLGKEFLEKQEEDLRAGRIKKARLEGSRTIINRYFTPYFGSRKIDEITEVDIFRYQDWRIRYWPTGAGASQSSLTYERRNGKTGKKEFITRPIRVKRAPSSTTMRTECSLLRTVFEQGRRWGYIQGHQIPQIKSPPIKVNRRPHFEINEYRHLTRVSVRRYKKAQNSRVRKERQNMHDWLLIMSNTGMRPTEAKNLKWGDVEYHVTQSGDTVVRIWVHGKGKKRDLVAMPHTKIYLDRLKLRSPRTTDADHVFLNIAGEPIGSYLNGFNALLKEAGLLHDKFGKKRAPYSLRHTYASFALIYGRVNVFTLAMNMGTSVDMIEKHYGHVKPLQAYKELTTRYKL